MYYGGDYNPEQWPRETWREDVALMREAGVNLVNVGIFSWSRIQPAEGEFDFAWLDEVLELLHEGGIGVNLATGTASPPPWAVHAYPEILPRDANGSVLGPGARQHFAPSSATYRRLATELVTALAARYADHPAVKMWHVDNELGCHLHHDYSEHAASAFRRWLRERYGSIDALNAAWGTAFWSQIYTDFEQILPPRLATYVINPAQVLDFKRYSSDALLSLFTLQRDIIRAAGATQAVTTNFMGAFPPADYWRWAQEMDVIADDSYPDPNDAESFRGAALARDLMRSLKPGTPWILMEQATNAVNWRETNAPKAPGQMAALSMQAVAHGADGIQFFQWRQSRRGVEKFHSAMVPQAGLDTRVWRDVVALGETLHSLPEESPLSHARIAIVFDWHSWWALEAGSHPVRLPYAEIVQRWYSALHRLHHSIDFVPPSGELAGYDVVLAPSLYLLDDAGAAKLNAFVEAGGTMLMTAYSDVVDEHDAFRDGGFLVTQRAALGVRLEEFGALVPPAASGASLSAGESEGTASATGPGENAAPFAWGAAPAGSGAGALPAGAGLGQYLAETIHPEGAEVLGRFTSGRLAGAPALTRHGHGAGIAYYVATVPDDAGMGALLGSVLAAAGIEAEVEAPEEVEFARRGATRTVINHGAAPAVVRVRDTGAEIRLDPFAWERWTVQA